MANRDYSYAEDMDGWMDRWGAERQRQMLGH